MTEQAEIGIALAVLGPLAALAWGWMIRRIRRNRSLAREGRTTVGRLTKVTASSSAQGYRSTVVHYAFEAPAPGTAHAESRTWHGKAQLSPGIVDRPAPGTEISVVYLPAAPACNAIARNRDGYGMVVMIAAIMTGLFTMVASQLF